jgi:uncharacterized delta-60 repeat protein
MGPVRLVSAAALCIAVSAALTGPAVAAPDPAYDGALGTGFDRLVFDITSDGDGTVVGGRFTTLNGTAVPANLVRLTATGAVDTAFSLNLGTGFDGDVYDVAVQADGKILVAGAFHTLDGEDVPDYLVRLNANGSPDAAFNAALGTGFDDEVNVIAVQPDGQILVGGLFASLDSVNVPDRLVRLTPLGAIDAGFNESGVGFGGNVFSLEVRSSGRILVGGAFASYNDIEVPGNLIQLTSAGDADTLFNTFLGTGFDDFVYTTVTVGGGGILVGGRFTTLDSGDVPDGMVKLNADGSLESAFNSALGSGFADRVKTVAEQSDGQLLVGGLFTTLNGADVPDNLVRLTSAGVPDDSFSSAQGSGYDDDVESVIAQNGGAALVAGTFTTLNSASVPRGLMRLVSAPSAPRDVTAAGLTGSTRVTWVAPAALPGGVTGYTATATAAGKPTRTCTAPSTVRTCTILGLANAVTYTVTVKANSANGFGPSSAGVDVTPRIAITVAWRVSGLTVTARFTAPAGPLFFSLVSTGATAKEAACARVGTKTPTTYTCTMLLRPGTSRLTVWGLTGLGTLLAASATSNRTVR